METILYSDSPVRNSAETFQKTDGSVPAGLLPKTCRGKTAKYRRPAGGIIRDIVIFGLLICLAAEFGAAAGIPVMQPFERVSEYIRAAVSQEKAVQLWEWMADISYDLAVDSLPACGFSRAAEADATGGEFDTPIFACVSILWEKMAGIPVLRYAVEAEGTGTKIKVTEGTDGDVGEENGKSGESLKNETDENGTGGGNDSEENGDGSENAQENGAEEDGAGGGDSSKEDGDGGEEAQTNGTEEGGEDGSAQTAANTFLMPSVTGILYTAEALTYSFLTSNFYNISSSTVVYESELNGSLLSVPLTLSEITEEPQILIYHTHSHEFFADSDTSDLNTGIVGVGNYLTELLEGYGYSVLHLTDQFDYANGTLDRSKAYTYAAARLKEVLAEYPSIEVMIDLHRDGIDDSMHLVTEINGKATAMIMFFNGMSRTTSGNISYLPNQNLKENLAFSLQLKVKAEAYYPGFTRKNYIKPYRYNLHLLDKSLLIEAGAQTNTFEEVKNAMEPLAALLYIQLSGIE